MVLARIYQGDMQSVRGIQDPGLQNCFFSPGKDHENQRDLEGLRLHIEFPGDREKASPCFPTVSLYI